MDELIHRIGFAHVLFQDKFVMIKASVQSLLKMGE
jgi:hypothetical protein